MKMALKGEVISFEITKQPRTLLEDEKRIFTLGIKADIGIVWLNLSAPYYRDNMEDYLPIVTPGAKVEVDEIIITTMKLVGGAKGAKGSKESNLYADSDLCAVKVQTPTPMELFRKDKEDDGEDCNK